MRRRVLPIQERGLLLLIGVAVLASGILVLPGVRSVTPRLNRQAICPENVQILLPTFRESEPVNINRATLDELATLPGIGPALAQRIIDYRIEHGPFASVESLERVSGIGPITVKEILAEGVVVSEMP